MGEKEEQQWQNDHPAFRPNPPETDGTIKVTAYNFPAAFKLCNGASFQGRLQAMLDRAARPGHGAGLTFNRHNNMETETGETETRYVANGPMALPAGWIERLSKTSDVVEYYHKEMNEIRAVRPLPAGWIARKSKPSDEVEYYHKEMNEIRAERPDKCCEDGSVWYMFPYKVAGINKYVLVIRPSFQADCRVVAECRSEELEKQQWA